jgi:hypothetical protein
MDIDMLDCWHMSRQSLGLGKRVLLGLGEAAERDHDAVHGDMFLSEISIRQVGLFFCVTSYTWFACIGSSFCELTNLGSS